MRLNTDNPDTMPITDSVYGRRKFENLPRKAFNPQVNRQLWQAIRPEGIAALRNLGGRETKRFFHIRTKGQA